MARGLRLVSESVKNYFIHFFCMVTYCNVADVRRILSLTFSPSAGTNPTDENIQFFIEEAEDEIDATTYNSWRENTATNELYNLPDNMAYRPGAGIPIKIRRSGVRTFDTNKGDKIEVWNGGEYEDFLTTRTQGRADDFWVDYDKGFIWFRFRQKGLRHQGVRLTYRYGATNVPKDLRQACACLTAMFIVAFDDRSGALMETGDPSNTNDDQRLNFLRQKVNRFYKNHTSFTVI